MAHNKTNKNMKKRTLLLASMAACALMSNVQDAFAESVDLKPTQTTKIQGNGKTSSNADVVLYDADATSWTCSYAKISNGAFTNALSAYDGTPVVLTKFDASSTLTGKMVTKATLTFKSICTVSGKNSSVQVAQVNTGWDATTATWTNTNTSEVLGAVNLNGDGTNVKTSEATLTLDVTDNLKSSTDNTIGFGIYTYTGREQKVYDFNLAVEYIDASASANYTIKYVDGNGNEIKESVQRAESTGASISLKDEDKASVYNADRTKKYIYVSDDSEGKTVASDGSTVVTVTFREAGLSVCRIDAVDSEGNTIEEGIKTVFDFEGETINVAYPYALKFDSDRLFTSKKLSSDGKGYYFTVTLPNDSGVVKTITYTASDITDVVYFSEAENIEGLTLTTNNNTAIRSSNGASAYAADKDVVFTKLSAGKYKLTTVICDATSKAGSVWKFKAGNDTIFTFTATSVNWSSGTSDEFTLTEDAEIALCKGGNGNIGVDFIYIQRTGDYVAPENVVEHFSGLMNLADNSEVVIKTTDAVITATGYAGFGMSVYAQDATGAVKLSNDLGMALSGMGLGAGSKIVGTIYAVYSAADGTPTLGLSEKTGESVIDMEAGDSIVAPIEMTIAEAKQTENLSKYVEVKDAKMFGDIYDIFYIAQGTDTIQVYDQFWALPELSETLDSIEYIKGVVVLHEGVPTIYPYGDDAIATKGEVVDPTVEVEGIGGLANVEPYSDVKLTLTNAKVTVVSKAGRAITAYVEDETGALEFGEIAETLDLKAGMTISGTIYATYDFTMAGMSLMANDNTADKSSLDIEEGEAVAKATTIAEVKDEYNVNRFVSFSNVNMAYDEELGQIYMTQGTDTIIIYNAFDVFEWDEEYNLIIPANVTYTEGILGISDDVYIFSPTKVDAQTDGINAAAKASAKVNAAVYTVNGTMVRKAGESLNGLAKGVYIVGGKKVVVK